VKAAELAAEEEAAYPAVPGNNNGQLYKLDPTGVPRKKERPDVSRSWDASDREIITARSEALRARSMLGKKNGKLLME
jgi:hypothetical protein